MIHVYRDVSGSAQINLYRNVIEYLQNSYRDVAVFDFDMDVRPSSDVLYGFGGTNIDAVIRHAEESNAEQFHVLTDGYHDRCEVKSPDKWTWWIFADDYDPSGFIPSGVHTVVRGTSE